ncbi:hypothetical protein SAMN05518672_102538 [Chitinophaga sp. CF118]|uniref:DUF6934 family protein n=1 Tax=Chitinophaga sp. CF118 TaxID=1884367 RepID=UPI0008F42164|nr:hypothetical protein [Chitinophaga sp. CF118]SFD59465.1 hypothetical protein SAMN05518672_102538 [Chitinophaga sp. CF118]
MAIAVKINFDNVYDINSASGELTSARFVAEQADGSTVPLIVKISTDAHELMPNVYNLAFGPPDQDGELDDKAQLIHKDYSKVFSTILSHARAYLALHPDRYLGIDGSNNSRAFMYYRFILNNFDYLDNYFDMGALKYYVRITRFGKYQYENPFDFNDVKSDWERITRDSPRKMECMYNYFIFKNKSA